MFAVREHRIYLIGFVVHFARICSAACDRKPLSETGRGAFYSGSCEPVNMPLEARAEFAKRFELFYGEKSCACERCIPYGSGMSARDVDSIPIRIVQMFRVYICDIEIQRGCNIRQIKRTCAMS